MTTPEIFVKLHEFDKSRLVIRDAVTKELGEGEKKTPYTYSEAFYKNDDGELCRLFFEAPTQEVWGLNEVYPYNLPEGKRKADINLKGFQVAYPLTSILTVKKPTKDEQYIKALFDAIFNATVDALEKECKKKNRVVPRTTYSHYTTAKSDGNASDAVKRIYSHPNMKDSKEKNKDKPMRTYVKLLTKGNGADLKCDTKIFGPDDEPLSARTLTVRGSRGKMTPVFGFEGLYWGQHGNTSPFGVSARFFLDQCNYTPLGSNRGSSRRFLQSNTDSAPDEDSAFSSPTGEEDFKEGKGNPLEESQEETDDLSDSDKSEEEPPEEPKPKKKPRRKQIKRN